MLYCGRIHEEPLPSSKIITTSGTQHLCDLHEFEVSAAKELNPGQRITPMNTSSKTAAPDDKSNPGILLTIHDHPVILTETLKIFPKVREMNAKTPVISL